MNQHLEDILNLIQQSKGLSAAEKKTGSKAVKGAEAESQAKNRELEIESALEKVRSTALAMKQPADMLDVCHIISEQLELMKVKDIRNVQTAIINEAKGIYLNYEYFTQYKRTSLLEIEIKLHPTVQEFVNEILKSDDAFFTKTFEGEALKDWRQYRKKTNQDPDPILDKAKSLHYYFYSIGPGALGVSTYSPLKEEDIVIFKRFRNAFELAYRRFIDIEKAEAQAREAKLEASLERVRAVAMGMMKSDGLLNVCESVFKELRLLGFSDNVLRNVQIVINNDDRRMYYGYQFSEYVGGEKAEVPYDLHPVIKHLNDKLRLSKDAFADIEISGAELDDWKSFVNSFPQKRDEKLNAATELHYYFYSVGIGALGISTFKSLSVENLDILQRLRNVFNLSYQRYSDIKFAEAQAREAHIEASLERVRSRTMGMQKSEELKEVIQVVYEQFVHLNIHVEHTGFVMDYKARGDYDIWIADPLGVPSQIIIPYFDSVYYNRFNEAKEKGENFFATNLTFEEKNKFYQKLFEHIPGLPEHSKEFYFSCPGLAASTVLLENVCLYIENFSGIPYTDEENNTLMRFGNVFQQTYTRFLDLQKAEAQAREAQIEAALERTRTHSMLMQHSNELDITSRVFHEQLLLLGIESAFSYVWLPDVEKEKHLFWSTWTKMENGSTVLQSKSVIYDLDKTEPYTAECFIAWESGEPVHVYPVPSAEVKQYFETWSGIFSDAEKLKPEFYPDGLYYIESFMKYGCFGVIVRRLLTEDEKKILLRFTIEFERTYTRFLDLQKAEAQSREAQIEASLERVRAKAMAMHNSNDLSATASTVFTELQMLGIRPIRSGVGLLTKDAYKVLLYASTSSAESHELSLAGTIDMSSHPCLKMQYESCLNNKNFFPVLGGDEIKSYYDTLAAQISVPVLTPEQFRREQYGYYLPFREGYFYIWSYTPFTNDETNILNRFKAITGLTFRRYLDLQKAETQAREAKIEAALERVRSKAMAMHKSDDLNDAVAIVFEELDKLNLGMLRCGIGIINKEKRSADVFTTTVGEQGNIVQVSGDESLDIHPLLQNAFESWLRQEDCSYEMEGQELLNYYRALTTTNFHLPESQQILSNIEGLKQYTYHAMFQAGALFAFRNTLFPDEAKAVMKRFASVFNLTYTRFLDLQKAEAQAREAEIEKKRSDALLLNILPEEIAAELKQFGKSYARKHEEVTVLFADIKGFSLIAENLSAEELVAQLDECFRAFDKIVEKHGLEKIKTVGDAYVCACGLPKPVHDNAVKTVAAALDMIEFIKGFGMTKKIQNLPVFEFRVGIHTGSVVTGVVGLKKFTYDIWGDAVNMAARMEQHGEAGKINISGNTYQLVKDKFTCTHRGKIQAKNKGEIDMYFVDPNN